MMRITFLSPYSPGADFKGGGVERYTWQLVKGLSKDNEVTVITSSKDFHDGFGNVNLVTSSYIETFRNRPLFIPWKLFLVPAEVVHVNSTYPMISDLSSIISRMKGTPSVLTYHFDLKLSQSSRVHHIYYKTLARLMKLYDKIIVTSRSYLEHSQFLKCVDRRKIEVIPLGVDTNFFSPQGSRGQDPKTKIQDQQTKILFVGELVDYKGVGFLLDTLSKSRINFELRLVGDGQLRGQLMKKAAKLKIADRVTFSGRVPDNDLLDSYHWCHFLVMPSTFKESFGLVLLEAQACAKPVIGPDLPGVFEAVGDGGLTFSPGNIDSLLHAIQTLSDDEKLRASLGKRGRRRVCRGHSLKQMIERTKSLYLSIL